MEHNINVYILACELAEKLHLLLFLRVHIHVHCSIIVLIVQWL